MTGNTNLNTWVIDPEDGSEGVVLAPVKKKRTRRNRPQIDADDAAIALGFKDAADQAACRPQMKEALPSAEIVNATAENPLALDSSKRAKAIIDLCKVHDLTPGHREMTGLTEGTKWNLSGRSFTVSQIRDDGSILFSPT